MTGLTPSHVAMSFFAMHAHATFVVTESQQPFLGRQQAFLRTIRRGYREVSCFLLNDASLDRSSVDLVGLTYFQLDQENQGCSRSQLVSRKRRKSQALYMSDALNSRCGTMRSCNREVSLSAQRLENVRGSTDST
jgi:hypothetical protein